METKRFTQILCVYHPQQLITNFCRDRKCLMPLCPYCIRQHTEQHQPQGTKPLYCTIQESISGMATQLQNLIFCYEQDKARNSDIIMQIHQMQDIIHEKILIAKNITYRAIDDSFDELEKSIYLQMEKTQQELNVYSLKESLQYDSIINQNIDQLYYMLDGLKRETVLANLIEFHKEKHSNFLTLHSQISQFLENNEHYTPSIQISHENVHRLNAVISRMIKAQLKVNSPSQQNQQFQKKQSKISMNRKEVPLAPSYQNEQLNKNNSRTLAKSFHNDNSPYKHPVGKTVNQEDPYRDYRNEYENLSQRVHDIRRQNQALSKILKY